MRQNNLLTMKRAFNKGLYTKASPKPQLPILKWLSICSSLSDRDQLGVIGVSSQLYYIIEEHIASACPALLNYLRGHSAGVNFALIPKSLAIESKRILEYRLDNVRPSG
jgi:hypothetical protein